MILLIVESPALRASSIKIAAAVRKKVRKKF